MLTVQTVMVVCMARMKVAWLMMIYGKIESDREQAGGTLEDLFFFNDEEEDDSDWEPSARLVVNRWFCLSCTVPNMDEVTHCMNYHELKGSEVAGYAVFKTHIAQTALVSSDTALPPVSTAIGFDERMLLHSEIEIKPNPHPERPDRLRAIAASLAAAGIFPSKCALVPPREITKEEFITVSKCNTAAHPLCPEYYHYTIFIINFTRLS